MDVLTLYLYIYYLSKSLLLKRHKVVFSRCEDVAKDSNTRDHLAWIIGNGDPMHGVCIPHSIPRASMGTSKVKEEEKPGTRIIAKE